MSESDVPAGKLKVEVQDGNKSSPKVYPASLVAGKWTQLTITKDEFSGADLTDLYGIFKVTIDGGSTTYHVNQVRWESNSTTCPDIEPSLVPTQGLILDSFENSRNDNSDTCLENSQSNFNLLDHCSTCFSCPGLPDGSKAIETSLTRTPQDALWCSGSSLALTYDVSSDAGGSLCPDRFAGYVVSLTGNKLCDCEADAGAPQCPVGVTPNTTCSGFDAFELNFSYLTFWVRFDANVSSADVMVKLKDVCDRQGDKIMAMMAGYASNHWGAWTKVKIPFAALMARNDTTNPGNVDTRALHEINFTFEHGKDYAPKGTMYIDDIAFEP